MANAISAMNRDFFSLLRPFLYLSQRALPHLSRYGTSLAGPMSVSAVHFGASILTFHALGASDFGLFSFAIIVTSFSQSVMAALLGAPMSVLRCGRQDFDELKMLCSANAIFSGGAGLICIALFMIAGAPIHFAAIFGAYGVLMCVRAVARSYSYMKNDALHVTLGDSVYALVLIVGFIVLWTHHRVNISNVALVMLAGAFISLASSNKTFLQIQLAAIVRPTLHAYKTVWQNMTRWSLLGVITSEISANAHAYIVTFFAGTSAFALLSIGSVLMRPINLTMKTLADVELRAMGTHLDGCDKTPALRLLKRMDYTSFVLWGGTLITIIAIFQFTPQLLLKGIYSKVDVAIVVGIWLAILLARITRTSRSILLQASGKFKPLAKAGITASLTSFFLTGALLAAFGPIYSLLGVLLSELWLTKGINSLASFTLRETLGRSQMLQMALWAD